MIRRVSMSLLAFGTSAALLGVGYYLLPGFPHLFTVGTDMQANAAFLCLLLFVFGLLTAVQLAPQEYEEEQQSGTCWACGRSGAALCWWTVDAPGSNQRVSYLIHRQCTWLAEKQSGL